MMRLPFVLLATIALSVQPLGSSAVTVDGRRVAPRPAPKAPPPPAPAQTPVTSTPTPPPVPVAPSEPRTPNSRAALSISGIEGKYAVAGGSAEVRVSRLSGDVYLLTCSDGWEGVGFLDGSTYHGVIRQVGAAGGSATASGEQLIDWSDPGNPSVEISWTSPQANRLFQRWRRSTDARIQVAPPPAPPPAPGPGHRPALGEYVYVEELPEAITKVPPTYPDQAREARVQGTLLIKALVLEDGTVGDCRVVNSIPLLDEAAVAAVRQWRFKPAMSKGVPVAVWVDVPVKFSLH